MILCHFSAKEDSIFNENYKKHLCINIFNYAYIYYIMYEIYKYIMHFLTKLIPTSGRFWVMQTWPCTTCLSAHLSAHTCFLHCVSGWSTVSASCCPGSLFAGSSPWLLWNRWAFVNDFARSSHVAARKYLQNSMFWDQNWECQEIGLLQEMNVCRWSS